MVDVVGWRLDEVVKLIRGPKGSQVRLEVIPASNAPNDQTSKIVAITREAVKLEDQAAKKSIIKVDHEGRSYKLGVIDLPASTWTSRPTAPATRTTRAPPAT